MPKRVQPGIDVLIEDPALLHGRRFGLLANQASVTTSLVPAWRALADVGGRLVRLFAPEHGLWGMAQDMEAVASTVVDEIARPVFSLYGSTVDSLVPPADLLTDLDAVVVDLPDIGCRYYTFAATMAHMMAVCEKTGTEVIVLDRPNPIGGVELEGSPVEPECRSFVSELPVPVRHGMTLGELALLLRRERHPDLALTIVQCRGWQREDWFDATGLVWVAPSPNMPTLTTATIYPGACLFEATNLSEGRGTTRPFQLLGAPWIDGERLAASLNGLNLPGAAFRATVFRPEFHKHAHLVCGGVEWHITDRNALRPLLTGMHILAEVCRLWPERFAWRAEPYEFVADVPAIDLLTGSSLAREVIEGRATWQLLGAWDDDCARFAKKRQENLIY